MDIIKTPLEGLLIIKPRIFEDERGYFFESHNNEVFLAAGIDVIFVQDNESKSRKDVIRGMHLQAPPFEQGKLVRVLHGSVLDVAVDIRKDSPTYGKWAAVELSSKNKLMYWIPAVIAHGYRTLEDDTVFFYKCTNVYHPEAELCFTWNDPAVNIDWGIATPVISPRDQKAPAFRDFKTPF